MALTGINYPWLNYGWDFGDPPPNWTGGLDAAAFRASQRDTVARDLGRLAPAGVRVVRWFVLADGLAYNGPRSAARIVEDFKALLPVFEAAGVKLLPSLVDFHWCFPIVEVAEGITKCGRAGLLADADHRREFLDSMLDPLLEAAAGHAGAIYAWEVINEPEWCTQNPTWKIWERPGPEKTVALEDMRAYIRDAAARVNARGFLSTVGCAHWETVGAWHTEDLGIGLQQFHYYAQGGAALPRKDEVTAQQCLLGEFASAPTQLWPGEPLQSLDARMRLASASGYAGALPWSMRATDDATLWNDAQLALLAAV